MKFDIWRCSENLSRLFKFHLYLTRIRGTLHEDLCTCMTVSRWVLLIKWNILDKNSSYKETYFRRSRIENQNTHFTRIYEVFATDSLTRWIIIYNSVILLTQLSAIEDFIVFCRRDTVSISNILFMLNYFFPLESYRILVNVEKYGTTREATCDDIRLRRKDANWMWDNKGKNTDTLIGFPQQQWLREGACMSCYTYIVCLVRFISIPAQHLISRHFI